LTDFYIQFYYSVRAIRLVTEKEENLKEVIKEEIECKLRDLTEDSVPFKTLEHIENTMWDTY
jgi:hypothetical protein